MRQSLYNLTNELDLCERLLDEWAQEHEGDITDFPLAEELDKLGGDKEEKVLNVGVWVKNLLSDANAIGEEIKGLTDRKRVLENKAQRIKDYLQMCVPEGQKYENSRCKIGWRKSDSILVNCEATELPANFQKVSISADKMGLKKAIKEGDVIPNVELINRQNIQIK